MFITWKCNKWTRVACGPKILWGRPTCNVFIFTFIKHLFKRKDVLNIRCLVEKVINHIVLMWTIRFNLKLVNQKPVEVCITWKVIRFLEFYIFPGYKNINRLYGAMAQWLRCWIPNAGVPCTEWLQGRLILSSFRGRLNEFQEIQET